MRTETGKRIGTKEYHADPPNKRTKKIEDIFDGATLQQAKRSNETKILFENILKGHAKQEITEFGANQKVRHRRM